MNIFGVGPLEIVIVLLIGILVLGPEGMIVAGRKLGKFMRSIVTSGWWKSLQSSVDEVQNLPYKLMREAELEEWNELYQIDEDQLDGGKKDPLQDSSWRGPGSIPASPSDQEESSSSTESQGDDHEPSPSQEQVDQD